MCGCHACWIGACAYSPPQRNSPYICSAVVQQSASRVLSCGVAPDKGVIFGKAGKSGQPTQLKLFWDFGSSEQCLVPVGCCVALKMHHCVAPVRFQEMCVFRTLQTALGRPCRATLVQLTALPCRQPGTTGCNALCCVNMGAAVTSVTCQQRHPCMCSMHCSGCSTAVVGLEN